MDQTKIGKYINTKRKEKNLTQEQIAEQLLVTDRTISRWENGLNLPDRELIPKLCEILGISIDELFAGEDKLDSEDNMPSKKKHHYLLLLFGALIAFLLFMLITTIQEQEYLKSFTKYDYSTKRFQAETTTGRTDSTSSDLPYIRHLYRNKELFLYFDGKDSESSLNSIIARNNSLLSDTIILPFLDGTYTYTGEDDITITFENGTYHFNGDITILGLDNVYSSGKCSFRIKEIIPDNDHYLYKMYLKDSYPLLIGFKTRKRVIIYNNDQEYLFEK